MISTSNFVNVMMTSVFENVVSNFVFLFSNFLAVMDLDPASSRIEPGVQSGNDAQYVFFETDVRRSDGDLFIAPATIG